MSMLSGVAFYDALFWIVTHFFVEGILGVFFVFQGRKTNTKLLFYYGLGVLGVSVSLGLSTLIDFLTILITGDNMDGNLKYYMVWGPAGFFFPLLSYIWAELLIPKKKWYFVSTIFTLYTLYLLDLFIFEWTPHFIVYPTPRGSELVETHHAIPNHPYYQIFPFRVNTFTYTSNLAVGIGFLYKASGIKSLFRKKYIYLSLSVILFNLTRMIRFRVVETFGEEINFLFILTDFISYLFSYLALRAEPEQREKRVKKKITAKDSLFRIVDRPEHITDEEVSYYREQKICLMCKGSVTGFNIFLCPNCDTLYHEDCARALISMENACWVCNDPIDREKPTKPFKIVEEKKDTKIKNKNKLTQD